MKRVDGLVSLIYLVCLVCLVERDRPDRPDEPNQPSPISHPSRLSRAAIPQHLEPVRHYLRDEAKDVRPDARLQARKNRRCVRWNTLRIFLTEHDPDGRGSFAAVERSMSDRLLARIIHERFCCNRGFAAATSLDTVARRPGRRARRSVDQHAVLSMPPSLAGSALEPASPTLTRGPAPL